MPRSQRITRKTRNSSEKSAISIRPEPRDCYSSYYRKYPRVSPKLIVINTSCLARNSFGTHSTNVLV